MENIQVIDLGIGGGGIAHRNLDVPHLVMKALERGEGVLSDTGALSVLTGKYTGRSPDDKFIVDTPAVHDDIAWGKTNVPISKEKFEAIKAKILAYLQNKELFVFDGFAGADDTYRQSFRIVNELASQNLFIHQLLVRPTQEQLASFAPDYIMYVAPGFKCIPEVDGVHSEAAIIINYESHEVVIAGSQYAGEIKKSVFSVMNYVLPKKGVLPMHCSANIGHEGDSAVFFGLSGTGKTTLSADPDRFLIGDDEHGWSDKGVFNIEGGCYAKCIGLQRSREPEIFDAIRFGSLLENVIVSEEGVVIRVKSSDVSKLGRSTQGVKVMNIGETDRVSAVARMVARKKKAARVDPMQGALELGVPAEDDPIDIGGDEVLDETMIDE